MKKIKVIPVLCKRFDMDKDGVPDWRDCQPFNPRKQHTKKWKQQIKKREQFKREHADDILIEVGRGWSEEKAITRMMNKPSSNLEKLMIRHRRISNFPDVVAFTANDIRRTKEVKEYIDKHNLKDLGSEIRL